jgi:hypothetical protein
MKRAGLHVDGSHTLGENIADLGGLATAYDAMTKATAGTPDPKTDGLTRDQRFFLNWATVWRRNFTRRNWRSASPPTNTPRRLPRDRCAVEHAGLRRSVLVQAGPADGARSRQAGCDLVIMMMIA